MALSMIKISGELFVPHLGTTSFQFPFGVTIEFTSADLTSAGGWIGSAPVSTSDHKFDLLTAYPVQTSQQANYAVYRDTQLIQQGLTTINNFQASIQLTEASYDKLATADNDSYVTIKGKITLGSENIPAIPVSEGAATVHVNKVMFRDHKELGSTTIDALGNYKIKIPLSALSTGTNTTDCCDQPKLSQIFVTLNVGGDPVESTDFIELQESCIHVDLHTDQKGIYSVFHTEFAHISKVITTATSIAENQFYTITTDIINSEGNAIIANTGLLQAQVHNMVDAAKIAYETGVNGITISEAYVFVKAKGNDRQVIYSLEGAEISNLMANAVAAHTIATPGDVSRILTVFSRMLTSLENAVKTDDGISLFDLVKNFITEEGANDADVQYFLELNKTKDQANMPAFWESISEMSGAANAAKLQAAIPMLAVTGLQLEMTKRLQTSYPGINNYDYALKSAAEWKSFIDATCVANGNKLCVPASIKGSVNEASSPVEKEQVKTAYANQLREVSSGLYATKVFADRLQKDINYVPGREEESQDHGDLRSRFVNPQQVVNYINTHPEFDFRLYSIWEENLSGLEDEAQKVLIKDVLPVQNLMRLTGNMPDAVAELLKQNIKGSSDIAGMEKDTFVSNFQYTFKDKTIAEQVYTKAGHTTLRLTEIKTQVHSSNYMPVYVLEAQWADWIKNNKTSSPPAPTPNTTPDMETLFGSMDLCGCSDCMSMYSPAAYFTDVLNFLKTKLGNNQPFAELQRRRPDLMEIDLTCKNANTPMPYVDLVNELLERLILDPNFVNAPFSLQTSGTSAELAAYPEHTQKLIVGGEKVYAPYPGYLSAYDELKTAVYPNTLPYNRPIEESRTYLRYLGYSRQELMQKFKPADYLYIPPVVPPATQPIYPADINEYNAMAELLGLSRTEADIIVALYHHPAAEKAYEFYGYSSTTGTGGVAWYNELADGPTNAKGLRFLLERSNINYKQMLELLETRFLNHLSGSTQKLFKVVSTDPAAPDTCQLDKLHLERQVATGDGTSPLDLFNKWYRFIRLWKATGWSIYQLDMVLASLDKTTTSSNNILDTKALIYVAKVHRLSTQLGIAPERVSPYWSKLDNFTYINFNSDSQVAIPSVYNSLFQNKAISNPTDPNFVNPSGISDNYDKNIGTISAGTGLNEDELLLLYPYFGVNNATPVVNSDIISRLYAIGLISKSLGISVKDIIRTCSLFEIQSTISAPVYDQVYQLEQILAKAATLRTSPFSLDELEYLIMDKDDKKQFNPANETIKGFYEGLRTQLAAFTNNVTIPYGDPLKDLLIKAIIQQFSDQFGMNGDLAAYLLDQVLVIDYNSTILPLPKALADPDFISSSNEIIPGLSTPGGLNYTKLYTLYRLCFKIGLQASKLKLETAEIIALQYNHDLLDITDLATIPAGDTPSYPVSVLMNRLIYLTNWIKVRDQLNLSTEEFIKITDLSSGTASIVSWKDAIINYTGWNVTDLDKLVGAGAQDGVLKVNYPTIPSAVNDFRYATFMLQLAEIITAINRIGLSAQAVYETLLADIASSQSANIRKAAKAKHDDEAWAKIAKPLQDVLREGQRKALVSYVIHAGNVNNGRWVDENDLYAYLLIDVEMKPCMKTSRIKQGISSIQLFMDRLVMKLETVGGVSTAPIYLAADKVAQWKSWRKWYRIWEANRKIFLYPENWIEPDLRDDKTPFFKELETQLLQDEVNDKTAEDAMFSYLERVSEIGRLEPVNAYHEVDAATGTDIKHIFARTHAAPHRYYYRKKENNEWTPWEKVNVDIKSEHVTPVIWNKRLYLFWITFQKKKTPAVQRKITPYPYWANLIANKNQASGNPMDVTEEDRETAWEIKMNWSQYKDGKWLATEIAKDTMVIFPERIRTTPKKTNTINAMPADLFRKWVRNGDTSIPDIFRDRVFLYVTNDSPQKPDVDDLCISLVFPPGFDEAGIGLYAFIFPNGGEPYVLRNNNRGHQVLAPRGTRFLNMKFAQMETFEEIGKLWIDADQVTTERDKYFLYEADYLTGEWDPNITYALASRNTTSSVLFNKVDNGAVGRYRISTIANKAFGPNPTRDHFFYEDNRNTYFAERVISQPASTNVIRSLSRNYNVDLNIGLELSQLTYSKQPFVATNPSPGDALAIGVQPIASTVQYRFQTFYHAQITNFVRSLNKEGIPGLLQLSNQSQADTMNFSSTYLPTNMVNTSYPANNVQFGFSDPLGIYNWEIFFHAPMMVAQRLADNQQFEEAQKWFHYIFDPTSSKDINGQNTPEKKRFWKFYPFYTEAQQSNVQTLIQLLAAINANSPEAVAQVKKWERNPFKPHVIARMRILAYMKNVVMKYLDNLVAWGDQLYRQDTIESINEATQLYVLAANILGKRPEEIPPRAQPAPSSFNELGVLDALSNAMVNIESYFSPNAGPLTTGGIPGKEGDRGLEVKMFYFCLPKNDKLMAYWNTVADRLFKIRNCMNIDGTVRELPLYEPPIDPALLVRAAALGISMDSIMKDINAPALPYRFSYVLQKANEFCGDVRSLGNSLLSAIEKKDAEQLALIRSGNEIQLLEKVRTIKEAQVRESEANLETSRRSKENVQIRHRYYSSRAFMNPGEQQHLDSIQSGLTLQVIQGVLEGTAGALSAIPTGHVQGFASGISYGGLQLANVMRAASAAVGIAVMVNNAKGSMALTRAGYERRRDDWAFQTESAAKELEQADQQILASEIRLDIANRELSNHELQMEQSSEVDSYMRSKFSNQELYTWMVNQVAATYFQSYQMAYDLACQAEKCFDLELPAVSKPGNGFIKFGYWDSLRKGLMSGERLQLDLRKMEATYMDENKRELELTKNISLSLTDPKEILELRTKGVCSIFLPEEIFDLDYPGHFNRRIKSVSISIPCIAGPYTTIPATLSLKKSAIRKRDEETANVDVDTIQTRPIATSTAQNDSGLFELNFRDERYLPFEGRGAISKWELSLLANPARLDQPKMFNFETITDVILHLRYTAQEGKTSFKNDRIDNINDLLEGTSSLPGMSPLPRYFSLKHEFSNEWYEGFNHLVKINNGAGAEIGRKLDLKIRRAQFPEYTAGKSITVDKAYLYFKNAANISNIKVEYNGVLATTEIDGAYIKATINAPATAFAPGDEAPAPFPVILYNGSTPPAKLNESDLSDVFLLMHYSL
jgi:hypothetical protein